jgi:hypothetical protein
MNSRFVPYASTPGRFTLQIISDIAVVLWTALWVLIGMAVHSAVSTIAQFGRQVDSSAGGMGRNLNSASERAHRIPMIGDALSKPFSAAGDAAHNLAGAGHNLDTTATWLAVVLALAVAAPPMLAIVVPWLIRRVRFVRRKWTMVGLTTTRGGEQLLALRALANRPLRRLAAVSSDPVGAWRREEAAAVRGLAELELRAAGISAPRSWRAPNAAPGWGP